jgi:AraC-like DNA-binding protein
MRAILQKVPTFIDSSFAVQEFKLPHFIVPWHFHPELELVLVLKSEGKRFVGDSINNFGPGDLVLLGSNIPHWYRNDAAYYEVNSELEAASIVIQFKQDFLGEKFFATPEAYAIRKLLQEAQMGLEILGQTKGQVTEMIKEMLQLSGMNQLLKFLSILNILSVSQEYNTLSHQGSVAVHAKDSERINTIYEYVMKNFKEAISIENVSALVHMCPATFCRYFKKRTRKTFTYFLNEIRIGHACKLLIEKDFSIAEICFASGYNNVSYFNRQFKTIKGTTPQAFKQEYHSTKKAGRLNKMLLSA